MQPEASTPHLQPSLRDLNLSFAKTIVTFLGHLVDAAQRTYIESEGDVDQNKGI